jgi:molybdate transport system permease protein
MTLDVDLIVDRDPFTLRAALTVPSGSVVAVLGPNGSGKTTLLRAVAGLLRARGRVGIDGQDVAAAPPHQRRVGWVPQDGALFPHLTVRDNVAFGIGGRAARDEAGNWLTALGVEDLADRKPARLSGGQAQKVALARALARSPRVLLLDEPLAALDAEARGDVRRTLRRHLSAFDGVTLLVTHDPLDAMSLADRVIALEAGTVVQDAQPGDVARAPRTEWLAGLMGVNAFRGRLTGSSLALADGGALTVAEAMEPEADALAVVTPQAVTLHRHHPEGSARNAWPVTVTELSGTGTRVRVRCDGRPPVVAEVTSAAVTDLGLVEGAEAWASVKATEVTVVLL